MQQQLRRRSVVGAVAAAAFLLLPHAAQGQDQGKGLAALDVRALNGAEQGLADLLNETILDRVASTGWFSSVLGGTDLRATLDHDQVKAALNCDAQSCLTELGGALGVPYLLVPSVGRLGSSFVLSMRLIQVEEGRVLARATARVKDQEDLLDGADKVLDQLLQRAFGSSRPKPLAAVSEQAKPESVAAADAVVPSVTPAPSATRSWRWSWKGWSGVAGLVMGATIYRVGTADWRSKDTEYRACLDRRPPCLPVLISQLDTEQRQAWANSFSARLGGFGLGAMAAGLIAYDLLERR